MPLISLPIAVGQDGGNILENDANRWLGYHGHSHAQGIEIEARCGKLQDDGRCGVYATRPMLCRVYKPGGPDCLDVVRRRRFSSDYQRIRGPEDPEIIHDHVAVIVRPDFLVKIQPV